MPFNPAKWHLIYQRQLRAIPIDLEGNYYPIPALEIAIRSQTLAIAARSPMAKPHWWLGVRVYPRLPQLGNLANLSGEAIRVPINRDSTLIILSDSFAPPAQLRVEIPDWYQVITISTWEYAD